MANKHQEIAEQVACNEVFDFSIAQSFLLMAESSLKPNKHLKKDKDDDEDLRVNESRSSPDEDLGVNGSRSSPDEDLRVNGSRSSPDEDLRVNGSRSSPDEDLRVNGSRSSPDEDLNQFIKKKEINYEDVN